MDQGLRNNLYPVFFRMDKMEILIVGAGEVGLEKLHFILKSSPNANITLLAPWANPKVETLIEEYTSNINWIKKTFKKEDISNHQIVIAATNFKELNLEIYKSAKAQAKIVNVADTPELCDFYMGSIVTRGNLKIAISTNGTSPTFAKRFRQLLESILPDHTAELLINLKKYRDQLTGDFAHKVEALNNVTASLINPANQN